MDIENHKEWLGKFYEQRGWLQLSNARRLNFLTEEVGELSQAIRRFEIGRDHPGEIEQTQMEQKAHIVEELADVMDEILIFCDKFDIQTNELFQYSEAKMKHRFDEA